MKKALIILLLFFIVSSSHSQSLPSTVVGSVGDYFSSVGGSLDWTLGEIMVETYHKNNGYFTQGFHQPSTVNVTGINEETSENLLVYPNPTKDFINILATRYQKVSTS